MLLFQTIPPPTRYILTHWGESSHVGMAYSFLPVGLTGHEYTVMADSVEGKIHLAGEVRSNGERVARTHQQCGQGLSTCHLILWIIIVFTKYSLENIS